MPPIPEPSDEMRAMLDSWLEQYFADVDEARKATRLTNSTAQTYTLHASNYTRWLKGEFEPGSRAR